LLVPYCRTYNTKECLVELCNITLAYVVNCRHVPPVLSVSTVKRMTTIVHHLTMMYELEDYVVAVEVRTRLYAMNEEEFAESAGLAT